jgi:uncharacterized protein
MSDPLQLLTLGAAFAAGFAGSTHCLVMCGGMAGALGMRARAAAQGRVAAARAVLLQQAGRISGYAVAGALVGGLSQGARGLVQSGAAEKPLRIAAGLVTLLIAIRVLSGTNLLARFEKVGAPVWRRLQPIAQHAARGNRWYHALGMGFAWGWLPCGMVYSLLLMAAASGHAVSGAAVMASFGLGTVPALFASSIVATQLPNLAGRPMVRLVSGALLVVFAAWMLLPPALLSAQHVH